MGKLHKWPYYTLIILAVALWVLLRFFQPERPNPNQYELSKTVTVILSVTLFIPYFLTWILAVTSSYKFKKLGMIGEKHSWPYAGGFNLVASGVSLLAADLIATALLGAVRNVYIYDHTPAMVLTIISNIAHITLPLLAFVFLYKGSKELLQQSRYGTDFKTHFATILIPVFVFVAFFALLVFSGSMRQFAGVRGQLATYYLPDILILFSVVIPIAITWFMGLRTILNIERFTHALNKRNLRKSIIQFYNGLIAVIGSSIILQALTALGSERLQRLGLSQILILIYLWIIVQVAAFAFLSRSAGQIIKAIEKPTGKD